MSGNAVESSCDALGSLFQAIVNDMKDSWPAFEDLASKTAKLHSTLRATMLAASSFLDAFQKVADIATNTRGATKDIGKALTRLCLRQKSIENKLKVFTSSLMDGLVVPMQEKTEDWKKTVAQLDKDHTREQKKAWIEIKKASSDTVRLQKKAKKGKTTYSKGDAKEKLESAMHNVTDKYLLLEDTEKKGVRQALIEERRHYCHFITCIEPLVKAEVSLVGEAGHLQEILDSLCDQAADPDNLPEASEHVITDVKGTDVKFSYRTAQTPPDSPTSLVRSRRSSVSSGDSSQTSASEADSAIGSSPKHTTSGLKLQIPRGSTGLMSVASQDSGFTSQDMLCYRSSVPIAVTTATAAAAAASDSNCLLRQVSCSPVVASATTGPYRAEVHDAYNYATLQPSAAVPGSSPTPQRISSASPFDWLPPASERPHTVSGVGGAHHSRPALLADTFVAPGGSLLAARQSSSSEHVGRAEKIVFSVGPMQSAVQMMPPPQTTTPRKPSRQSSQNGERNLPPPPTRSATKAKPVSTPVVPRSSLVEPVYVNTQELIDGDERTHSKVSSSSSSAITNASEVRASLALADAIRELEASTAALEALGGGDDGVGEWQASAVVAASDITLPSSGSSTTTLVSRGGGGSLHTSSSLVNNEISVDPRLAVEVGMQQQQQQYIAAAATTGPATVPGLRRAGQGETMVNNWAGQATLRRASSQKPPPLPPTRTSSALPLQQQSSEVVFDQVSAKVEPRSSTALDGTLLQQQLASATFMEQQSLSLSPQLPLPPSCDFATSLPAMAEEHFVLPPMAWRTSLDVTVEAEEDVLPLPPPPLSSLQPLSPQPPPLASPPLPPPPSLARSSGAGESSAKLPAHHLAPDAFSRTAFADALLGKVAPPAVAQKPRNRNIQQQVAVADSRSTVAAGADARTFSQRVNGGGGFVIADLPDAQSPPREGPEGAGGTRDASARRSTGLVQFNSDFVATLNAKLSGPGASAAAAAGRAKEKHRRTVEADESTLRSEMEAATLHAATRGCSKET